MHDFLDKRRHEHHVDAERFVRPTFALLNFFVQDVGWHVTRADYAQTARVRHRRGQLCRTNPRHAALKYRVLDVEQLTDGVIFKHLISPPQRFAPPGNPIDKSPKN